MPATDERLDRELRTRMRETVKADVLSVEIRDYVRGSGGVDTCDHPTSREDDTREETIERTCEHVEALVRRWFELRDE